MGSADILFVIVLYKQRLQDSESFISLNKSLTAISASADLFVYDNSPESQHIEPMESSVFSKIRHQHDPKNSGLSIAYNTAAEYARDLKKSWLFLLDQDTSFPDKTIETYLENIRRYPEIMLFAPVLQIANGLYMSPCVYKYKWGKLMKHVQAGAFSFENSAPVNSGICVNLEAFLQVGGYNEKVKLDGADFQFIERFKKAFKDYMVIDLTFHQDFSLFEKDERNLLMRFSMFLQDVRNFERDSFVHAVCYIRLAFLRTIKLTMQTHSFAFIKLYIKNHLLKRY